MQFHTTHCSGLCLKGKIWDLMNVTLKTPGMWSGCKWQISKELKYSLCYLGNPNIWQLPLNLGGMMTACILSSNTSFPLLYYTRICRILWWGGKNNMCLLKDPVKKKSYQTLEEFSGYVGICAIYTKPIVWGIKTAAEKGKTRCWTQHHMTKQLLNVARCKAYTTFPISQGIYEKIREKE